MARRPIEITIDRLIDYSNDEILEELRRVAALVKERDLTVQRFRPLARVSYCLVQKRFGCWSNALIQAGLADRRSDHPAADRRRAIATKAMTDAQILRMLRAIARAKRTAVLKRQDVLDHDRLSLTMLCRRFGSWPAAVAAAGLRRSRYGRLHSKQACLDRLVAVARRLGRLPRQSDLRRPPSAIRAQTCKRHFGGWNRALHALIACLGAGPPGDRASAKGPQAGSTRAEPTIEAKRQRADPRRKRLAENRQVISLTLRYRIFARDRFRCVACGNSPATDQRCKLHVDHVVPFSRGGKTMDGNLRTLCAACNIGRGDRVSD